MGKSYKAILTERGQMEEFIQYCKVYGRFKAMSKYGLRDDVSVAKLIEEATGDAKFGFFPQVVPDTPSPAPDKSLFDQLADAFAAKILRLEDEKSREVQSLNSRIEFLETQLAIRDRKSEQSWQPKVTKLMELCKGE